MSEISTAEMSTDQTVTPPEQAPTEGTAVATNGGQPPAQPDEAEVVEASDLVEPANEASEADETPEATNEAAAATEANTEPAAEVAPQASEDASVTDVLPEAADTSAGGAAPAENDATDETAVDGASKPAPEEKAAEARPARCEVETQAAVDTAVAQDPLEQPEPEDVHEVALEPEIPASKAVLVIQTDGQVRGTLAGGCRTLPWLAVHTASSVELGENLIKEETLDAIILSLDEGAEAIDLLTRIRLGECRVDAGVPVMALIQQATADIVAQLKPLGVTRLLLHPFTLGDVLETVEGMWTADGSPVVMPTDAEALRKAAEAKAEAKAEADSIAKAEAESAAADPSEGEAPAEPEVGIDTPVEGTMADAAAESEPVPA